MAYEVGQWVELLVSGPTSISGNQFYSLGQIILSEGDWDVVYSFCVKTVAVDEISGTDYYVGVSPQNTYFTEPFSSGFPGTIQKDYLQVYMNLQMLVANENFSVQTVPTLGHTIFQVGSGGKTLYLCLNNTSVTGGVTQTLNSAYIYARRVR